MKIPQTDVLTIATKNETFEMCGYANYERFTKTIFIRNNSNFERYSIIFSIKNFNYVF